MTQATAKAESILFGRPRYHGLRMTADEFFALPDDGHRYELVDGILIMSPSPEPKHQRVAMEILRQLLFFLDKNPIGQLYHELDIQLKKSKMGADCAYKPELVFIKGMTRETEPKRIVAPVDMVLEVVSPDRRKYDLETKRVDYEQSGIGEYWVADPELDSIRFWRRQGTVFVEVFADGDFFRSEAVPGFKLDINRVREEF